MEKIKTILGKLVGFLVIVGIIVAIVSVVDNSINDRTIPKFV